MMNRTSRAPRPLLLHAVVVVVVVVVAVVVTLNNSRNGAVRGHIKMLEPYKDPKYHLNRIPLPSNTRDEQRVIQFE